MTAPARGGGKLLKLVIFDCDGTLVDSQHAIVAAMNDAFRSLALALPAREAVVSVVGLSLTKAIAQLLPAVRDAELVAELAERYKTAFAELRRRPEHREPLFPGVRDALDELRGRGEVVLGMATGKSRRGVAAVLEREGLGLFFATVQTADTHPSKPHPSMILAAMAEVGAEPQQTVMIGDTTFDVAMARQAGVGALGVAWGYHPPAALREAGAQKVLEDCRGLVRAVDRLLLDFEAAS
jgi:phosphoglycolate phosphatase